MRYLLDTNTASTLYYPGDDSNAIRARLTPVWSGTPAP